MDKEVRDLAQKLVSEAEKASRALHRILDYLNVHASQEKNKKPVSREANPREENEHAASPLVGQANPAPHSSQTTQKRWYQAFPWWKVLEGTAFAFGIFYAVVTFWQWRDLRHNFKVDERAW